MPQLALVDSHKGTDWKNSQLASYVRMIRQANPDFQSDWQLASYAHTIQKDNKTWGDTNVSDERLAHSPDKMACQTCHSSWVPSCFGCHLPMKANMRRPILHYNGDMTRNWTAYNYQTLRNDVFMIAKDGKATGNRISPARSSCAVEVELVQCKPRSNLHSAADGFRRRILRAGVQHYRTAYGTPQRDQAMHRLPSVG